MNIALVGFTNSYNDRQWLAMAKTWIAEHNPAMATEWDSAKQQIHDLRGGRGSNFLDDRGEYDVVILFAIFNPPGESTEFRRAAGRTRGQTSLAANHSRDTWVTRLSRTNARYLLVFRRPDSVDGEWLGSIEGYVREPEKPGVFGLSVYWREGGQHTTATPIPPNR